MFPTCTAPVASVAPTAAETLKSLCIELIMHNMVSVQTDGWQQSEIDAEGHDCLQCSTEIMKISHSDGNLNGEEENNVRRFTLVLANSNCLVHLRCWRLQRRGLAIEKALILVDLMVDSNLSCPWEQLNAFSLEVKGKDVKMSKGLEFATMLMEMKGPEER
ncbi:hypothetical protein WISP_19272 [Willisornis vidua]|uniref:Uncharacterized protein n=1 Tax=Willisornis vidua TaxID=1566151 RepID=A0ABQ9DV89_9PASS|nr:hypothetical protein WISP_19272 [Willisornis vidua]